MNNSLEARRNRQNRTVALVFTLIFHVALLGGIYYFHMKPAEKKTEKVKTDAAVKPVSNLKRHLQP